MKNYKNWVLTASFSALLIWCYPALASCVNLPMFPADGDGSISVLRAFPAKTLVRKDTDNPGDAPAEAPVFQPRDFRSMTSAGTLTTVKGCLLDMKIHDGGLFQQSKITAYTDYPFMCRLGPDEEIKVSWSTSCCDVMPNYWCSFSGDNDSVHTSTKVRPLKFDIRSVPDSLDAIIAGDDYIETSLNELILNIDSPQVYEALTKRHGDLERAFGVHPLNERWRNKAALAKLLLLLEAQSRQDAALRAALEKLSPAGLDFLAAHYNAHPESGEKIVVFLMAVLSYLDLDARAQLLNFMPRLGPAVRPYLSAIYQYVVGPDIVYASPWLAAEEGWFEARSAVMTPLWNRLVCVVNGPGRVNNEAAGIDRNIPPAACPSTMRVGNDDPLAPLFQDAENGKPASQFFLGELYRHENIYSNVTDLGLGRNDKKSAYWYRRAAEQGSKHAQFQLAQYYREGRGVEKSIVEGVFWAVIENQSKLESYKEDMSKLSQEGIKDLKRRIHEWKPKSETPTGQKP